LAACRAKGIPACTTAYGDDVEARFRQGFKWLAVGNDTGTFTQAAKDRITAVKSSIEAASGK
jgi:2-keto-3-deoxy-L-rhamnonate aldolase RhmA